MLKVKEGAVHITLNGSATDPMFYWSMALLLVGVVVALICFTQPVPYAIGALALFAVLMFFFNHQKQKAKLHHVFSQGTLIVTPKRFAIDDKALTLKDDAVIHTDGDWLIVTDRSIEYRFTGFSDANEINVAAAVLSGRQIAMREVAVKMADAHQ